MACLKLTQHPSMRACRYRNRALGSDNEDEVVLHAIRDDLDDPYAVVLRNAQHEAKIKDWAKMDDTDKWVLQHFIYLWEMPEQSRKGI